MGMEGKCRVVGKELLPEAAGLDRRNLVATPRTTHWDEEAACHSAIAGIVRVEYGRDMGEACTGVDPRRGMQGKHSCH